MKMTREERNWVLYDVGNSAFVLLVSTIMPLYFNYLAGSSGMSDSDYLAYWGYAASIATIIVAVMGPVVGTMADIKGFKKILFTISMLVGAAGCISLGFAKQWLVFLGIRRFSHALLHNLGRETFLAPVTWKDGWPVVGYNGNGTIELVMDAPLPGLEDEESKKNIHIDSKSGKPMLYSDHSVHIDFSDDKLDKRLQFTRNPDMSHYIYDSVNTRLTLKGTDISLNEPGKSPTILSFKQPEFTTTLKAVVNIGKSNAARAGIAAYYNNDYHYEIYAGCEHGEKYIGFYKHIHDMGVELSRIPLSKEEENMNLLIKIDTDREKYTFSYALSDTTDVNAKIAYKQIGSGLNAGLSTEGTRTMTFTGTLFSLFAEDGDGVFESGVWLDINPDENYKL